MKDKPRHVAIIMDGNGRWATQRGLPRARGHQRGAKAVRRVVEFAVEQSLSELSLFAFSSDNWQRPLSETTLLMALLERYLRRELRTCLDLGIVLNVVGRRDRLSRALRDAIHSAERATAGGNRMLLRIAVDYSSRWGLAQTAKGPSEESASVALHPRHGTHTMSADQDLRDRLAQLLHAGSPISDVDLLIRSGGERRLSDFLLLECAYAELHFTDVLWPDFGVHDFEAALDEFSGRHRRFGTLDEAGLLKPSPEPVEVRGAC